MQFGLRGKFFYKKQILNKFRGLEEFAFEKA